MCQPSRRLLLGRIRRPYFVGSTKTSKPVVPSPHSLLPLLVRSIFSIQPLPTPRGEQYVEDYRVPSIPEGIEGPPPVFVASSLPPSSTHPSLLNRPLFTSRVPRKRSNLRGLDSKDGAVPQHKSEVDKPHRRVLSSPQPICLKPLVFRSSRVHPAHWTYFEATKVIGWASLWLIAVNDYDLWVPPPMESSSLSGSWVYEYNSCARSRLVPVLDPTLLRRLTSVHQDCVLDNAWAPCDGISSRTVLFPPSLHGCLPL